MTFVCIHVMCAWPMRVRSSGCSISLSRKSLIYFVKHPGRVGSGFCLSWPGLSSVARCLRLGVTPRLRGEAVENNPPLPTLHLAGERAQLPCRYGASKHQLCIRSYVSMLRQNETKVWCDTNIKLLLLLVLCHDNVLRRPACVPHGAQRC